MANPSTDTSGSSGLKAWLLLVFTISFQFCVFAPLEAYFSNESEYWFHLSHLLPVVLATFGVAYACLVLVALIFSRTKLSKPLYALVLVLLVYFYIQGNYVPRPYGVLNGEEIDWGRPDFQGIAKLSLVLLAASAILWTVAMAVGAIRSRIREIGGYVCGVLLGLQAVTLGTLYLQNNVLEDNSSPSVAMTADNFLTFSPNNNLFIILLDTFDGRDMNAILDGPDGDWVRSTLKDFTYYPDTLGLYPTTKGAVPHILTGQVYTNEIPFADYLEQAYRKAPLFAEMKQKDYSVCAFTSLKLVSPDVPVFENVYRDRARIFRKLPFAGVLYKLVAFNYLPHQFKRHFFLADDAFASFRQSLRTSSSFSENMFKISDTLKTGTATLSQASNTFRFYHARGMHPPYVFGKDLVPVANHRFSSVEVAMGCVTLLKEFFDQFESANVYDASTIIVMADHGHVMYRQNPIFLVKNRGERHAFHVSKTPMSYLYLHDLLVALVRDGTPITETSIAAVSPDNAERRYLYYQWDDSWSRHYLPIIDEMRLRGDASLPPGAVMERTGLRYGGSSDQIAFADYELGTTLQFERSEAGRWARRYLGNGFGMASKTGTWTCDTEADMRFLIKRKCPALLLTLDCSAFNGVQPVRILANGTEIFNGDIDGRCKRSLRIPGTCIRGDGKLTLRYLLPGACLEDAILHNGRMRRLAVQFHTLRIKEASGLGLRGKTFSFAGIQGAPARKFCQGGIGKAEKTFTWTDGGKLMLKLDCGDFRAKPIRLTLHYQAFLPRERVVVSVGDVEIANYIARGEEKKKFVIPPACISEDGTVTVTFSFPDAISPRELGLSGDSRRLALRLYSLAVR